MIYISAVGMINALGNGADEIAANLALGVAPGMRPREGWLQGTPQAVLAGVDAQLPDIPDAFRAHRSRNNQLLLAATVWRWCSAPALPGWTKAIRTLT